MKNYVLTGKEILGIEFGSTRIKAVLIDENNNLLATGSHTWENKFENGVQTYDMADVISGMQSAYKNLNEAVQRDFGSEIKSLSALGISSMMHGYLPFDKNGKQLSEFRTWRNTITADASARLTDLFNFNIPQRWSISHLYQVILNGEEHTKEIAFLTTLAGYVHYLLSGVKTVGVGEASGMFPIDSKINDYNPEMLEKFSSLETVKKFNWNIKDILPKVLIAGEWAGDLTEDGSRLIDPSGRLKAGTVLLLGAVFRLKQLKML